VLTMEQWATIKFIHKQNPSLGTRQLARLIGVSRNSVKRVLTQEQEPSYSPRPLNPELIPFCDYIYERLITKKLRGSRVLNEIRSKGYHGSKSQFYRYTSTLKKPVPKTCKPYETAPGEQAQFDWSDYKVPIDDVLTTVYVFSFILGFSRYRIYRASLSVTMASVYEAIIDSLEALGGVPSRMQSDNPKCFVTNASKDNFEWNKHYLALCAHYGFQPSRSLPKHPWSKGKVENPFDYVNDHFIADSSFASFEDFCAKLDVFQHDVNNRVHDTTRQKPVDMFEHEKPSLQALPERRHLSVNAEVRPVTLDCLISYNGCRYSVPHYFADRQVWLRISQGYWLKVYADNNALVATHRLSLVKGKVIIDESHYKNHDIERGSWNRLIIMFLERFPSDSLFLDKLKSQKRTNPAYHLTQVLELEAFYSKDQMHKAISACHQYNIFKSSFIKSFLENHYRADPGVPSSPVRSTDIITHKTGGSITRSLQEYASVPNASSSSHT
jgi:transposase